MTRVNWSEGGKKGHLLPEETGKGQDVVLSQKHERGEGERWPGTSYICIVKKNDMNDIGTTTLLENRENSQILSFYLVLVRLAFTKVNSVLVTVSSNVWL